MQTQKPNNLHLSHAQWLRADFHLHTVILKAKELISENSQAWLLVVLVFVYAVAVVLSSSVVVFGRMADTFVVAFIWAAYYIHLNGSGLFNKVAVLVLMFFLVGTFVKGSIGAETVYSDPKTNPYKMIFNVL